MPAAVAGVLSGAFMGLVFDMLLVRALQDLSREPRGWLRTALEQMTLARVALPLAVLSHALWTMAGLVMGIALKVLAEDASPGGPGGGPSLPYAAVVLGVTVLAATAALLYGGRARRWMLPVPVLTAAVFGLGLPLLAG